MSLAATISYTTPLAANPISRDDIDATLDSATVGITGTMGASDIAAGAVTYEKTKPGPHFYGTGGLTGATYAVTLNPTLASLVNGAEVWFKPDTNSPSGGCNANVDTLGAKPMYFNGGVAIPQGGIRANRLVGMRYNTSVNSGNGGWEVFSQTNLPDDHYQSTATTGTNDYVATFSPTIPALVDGTKCRWKVPNSNTGACTFAPDGLTAKAIKKSYNQALSGNELPAGTIAECVYDATNDWWQLTSGLNDQRGGALAADARNLVVKYSTAARVTVTADEVVLKTSGGSVNVSESVSVTVDMASTGANGLDTGAEAGTTWYAVWLIYNPVTGVTAGLFSTSTTSPTLPSGYTYKGLVGYVYNNGSSNFTDFQQFGRRVWTTLAQVHGAVGPTAVTAVSLTAFVPPAATEFHGIVGTTTDHATAAGFFQNSGGISTAIGAQLVTVRSSGAVGIDGALYSATQISVPLRTSQQFYWQVTSATPTYYIGCTGFSF